ncbi:DEAD/DEAH box helicase [Gordonia caeni]|uniref:Helicase n=1 Tax=Gordonia caeni TaxID=1007097 RepID=A0ABP7NY32_9ACTN
MITRSWTSTQAEQALAHLPLPDVHRGRGYAEQNRISGVEWTSPTVLRGTCRGSGRNRYQSTVTLVLEHGRVVDTYGVCSCPVASDCKHCAALVLAAVNPATTASPWRALVDELTAAAPAPATVQQSRPVGLEFQVRTTPGGGPAVSIRPMVRQPDEQWTPHLPWTVALEGSGDGYDPAGFDGVSAIAALFAPGGARRFRGAARLPATLQPAMAPAAFWKVLRTAVDAGLPLLADGEADTVDLTDRLALAYRIEPHDEGAHLSARVTLDGSAVEDEHVAVFGDPVTGAAVVRDRTLCIGPLGTVTPLESALLTGEPIDVPTADYEDFAAALPALAAHRTVEIPERGLQPPVVSDPFPLLTIEVEDFGSRTRWRTAYLVDGRRRDFDPDIPEESAGFRDGTAETTMWQRARPELELFCMGNSRWSDAQAAYLHALARQQFPRSPRVRASWSAMSPPTVEQAATDELLIPLGLDLTDTAILCGELVGRITAPGLIQVEITGVAKQFTKVTDPELHFGTTGAHEWLDLNIEIEVDGELIPISWVIEDLVLGKTHKVLPNGTYFDLLTPELERLRDLLEEARLMGDLEGSRISTDHPNATMWEELLSLGVVDEQLAEWQARVQQLARARPPEPVEVPETLEATLRGYQHDGLNWLSFLWDNRIGGILADDMGLGKTVQTLALITRAAQADPAARFLVVAPTSVIGNWVAETQRFAPSLTVAAVTSTQKRAGVPLAEQIGAANIVVTSYTLLRIDYPVFAEIGWDGAVFDEAQFLKNHNAKTHQAARRLPAPFKLAITGTPMENNVMELWSLISLVAPGLYGSPKTFKEHFAAPIESGNDPDRLSVLRRRLKPIMLRRTKDQVADDLPPKQESVVALDLDPGHRKIYDVFLARERQKVLGLLENWEDNRVQILQALTRMRQLSLHPGLVDDAHTSVSSTKIDYLAERLPVLIDEGHSALIFSSFTGFLQLIADSLTGLGIPFSYLDGSMPARKRQQEIDRFTRAGRDRTSALSATAEVGESTKVFLISLKAGGFGLNLTAADYCFVADPWWNPASEAQAVDRAHRIGQDRPVTVYRLVSTGTIEEKVVELQDRKRALFDALIDDGEQFSGKLTADDVRRLVTDD